MLHSGVLSLPKRFLFLFILRNTVISALFTDCRHSNTPAPSGKQQIHLFHTLLLSSSFTLQGIYCKQLFQKWRLTEPATQDTSVSQYFSSPEGVGRHRAGTSFPELCDAISSMFPYCWLSVTSYLTWLHPRISGAKNKLTAFITS